MADPKRLLEDPGAPREALSLLRALEAPVPPSADKRAELAGKLAALAAPVGGAGSGIAGSVWVKASGLGAIVIVAGAWWLSGQDQREPRLPERGSVTASARAVTPSAPERSETLPTPSAPPAVSATSPALELLPPPQPKRVAARDTLAEEELLLEGARRKAPSSPGAALSLLQEHQRRFPSGQLSAERLFLSVEVLERLGDESAARRQADLLIRRFPGSVYAQKLEARRALP